MLTFTVSILPNPRDRIILIVLGWKSGERSQTNILSDMQLADAVLTGSQHPTSERRGFCLSFSVFFFLHLYELSC